MRISRRETLALIPAAAALATAPALAALPAGEDPHPRLIREYWAINARWGEAKTKAAEDALHERAWAIMQEVCETPVTTAAGLAALVAFVFKEIVSIGHGWTSDIDVSAAKNIQAAVDRLAGGAA